MAQNSLRSHTPLTLSGLGHLDKYQNVKFNSTLYRTKFDPNRFVNINMHATVPIISTMTVKQQLFPLFQ